ncbi:MAG: hypothetical protein mread185_000121 [Mycoplasmataceae bacterium]|nr:MAG: hypothetical protein mread185_000121 [Mycoplasmataceae bacterium]
MTNNNNLIPKTETIAYFDIETDQNLTAKEWSKLYHDSSEIKTLKKSGSDFISEKIECLSKETRKMWTISRNIFLVMIKKAQNL